VTTSEEEVAVGFVSFAAAFLRAAAALAS